MIIHTVKVEGGTNNQVIPAKEKKKKQNIQTN